MNIQQVFYSSVLLGSICFPTFGYAQKKNQPPPSPIIAQGDGKIMYTPDSVGNRVPDFSFAGYMAREKSIPNAPIRVFVPPVNGDATLRIQSAIDYVASLPPDQNGIRGAVLLQKGTYRIDGQIKMNASGVVLRGSGVNQTLLLGAGSDRQTLIRVAGKNNRVVNKETNIVDGYVPVNAQTVNVADAKNFKVGENVIIHRPSTLKWIKELG